MALSVVSPIGPALARTRKILFQPFRIEKWLTLGFCAFLATLQQGGCSGSAPSPPGGSGGSSSGGASSGDPFDLVAIRDWIQEHLAPILIGATILITVLIAVTVLTTWLQSRGRLMFLDGVVRDRGAVKEPWARFKRQGNSLFRFMLAVCAAVAVLTLAILALGVVVAWPDVPWPDVEVWRFGASAKLGALVAVVPLVLLFLTYALVHMLVQDFVVPAMYARGVGAAEGWRVARREVLGAHPGTVALYVLMKIVISFVIAMISIVLMCATLCVFACLAAIPYVGAVVTLPFLVFQRCYSLCFLEQLGERWTLIAASAPPSEPERETDGW